MTISASARYRSIRSIMEPLILDERKWAKIPQIPADCFMLDLEDSVPPAQKPDARDRVVAALGDTGYFGGAVVMARPNHITTPWGADDLVALAKAGVRVIAYPKLSTPHELAEVRAILRENGADPDIFAIVETARSVAHVEQLADDPKVVGLMFGPGDLSVDSGIPLFDESGELNPAMAYPRVRTVLAGAAAGCAVAEIATLRDLRDLDEVRAKYTRSRQAGFTAGITFYPPHVPVINEVHGVSAEQVDAAHEIVAAYEVVIARGEAAVTLDDGRTLLVHDYERAKAVLVKATQQVP
jgi:citrate lyase beta subunit